MIFKVGDGVAGSAVIGIEHTFEASGWAQFAERICLIGLIDIVSIGAKRFTTSLIINSNYTVQAISTICAWFAWQIALDAL